MILFNSQTPFKLYWLLKAILPILSSHMSVTNLDGQGQHQLQLGLVPIILSMKTIHYQDSLK